MADADKKAGSFTVTDRRSFGAEGENKDEAPTTTQEKPPAAPARTPEAPRSLPPADFATLVLSLGSSAVMYMGEAPDPEGKTPTRNLPMAKNAIDLLTVLQEKTKGNLTAEEEQILESLLFDLRLRYVEAVKVPATASGG